ncbi:MAG: hypothetical protein IJ002_06110 [Clostridia bacterium]|nr:hypothetical protein [Clostridia bacterium]
MENNHVFSESYEKRKKAVRAALCHESTVRKRDQSHISVKIVAVVAILSALTLSVYAAIQWIDFHIEQDENDVYVHAGIIQTENSDDQSKPLRSWRAENGEISIQLKIPGMPSDMIEDKTAPGKWHGSDDSRAITINGIDLRRSALNTVVGDATEIKSLSAGDNSVYVIEKGETSFYSRIAFIVFEEEELVLMMWVGYGITETELLNIVSDITIEETADTSVAIPIMNENITADNYIPEVVNLEKRHVLESELSEIGDSVRDVEDWYTVTVNDVSIYDSTAVLNPKYILNKEKVDKFIDDSGKLITYNRTPIIYNEDGTKEFGQSTQVAKKLYCITLTMSDINQNEEMIYACVNGFHLHGYTVENGEVKQISDNSVIDAKPQNHAMTCEPIYREYLCDGQYKVAYLVDEDISEGNLVLSSYTGKVYIKIQ